MRHNTTFVPQHRSTSLEYKCKSFLSVFNNAKIKYYCPSSFGLVKKVYAFGELWDKKFVTMYKAEMLIHQSKANLDEQISFDKITHF